MNRILTSLWLHPTVEEPPSTFTSLTIGTLLVWQVCNDCTTCKLMKNWLPVLGNKDNNFSNDLCYRNGRCLNTTAGHLISGEEIHKAALSWKVHEEELIFEKWMNTTKEELQFHPLEAKFDDLQEAQEFCDGVCCSIRFISLHFLLSSILHACMISFKLAGKIMPY